MSPEIFFWPDIQSNFLSIAETTDLQRIRITTKNIENFRFQDGRDLKDVLLDLHNDDIIVTLVIGSLPSKKDRTNIKRDLIEPLIDGGLNIYYNYKVHSKMILMECKDLKKAIIMSANMTHGGFFYNFEAGVNFSKLSKDKFKKLNAFFDSVIGDDETRWIKDVI